MCKKTNLVAASKTLVLKASRMLSGRETRSRKSIIGKGGNVSITPARHVTIRVILRRRVDAKISETVGQIVHIDANHCWSTCLSVCQIVIIYNVGQILLFESGRVGVWRRVVQFVCVYHAVGARLLGCYYYC